ncbi:antA/AntB antirepressor family protein [Volucribacter amazonae]|uniref:Antirepressor n=1 Tax=Volucribacter amazonae TaxID=256731 RepID=A0A9X4PBN1_9PAST|nr:antA/AntB antirepressor family protein [Volucribacter amazonae]MDG6894396.1 antirepressor [Volucribacter amazonae]
MQHQIIALLKQQPYTNQQQESIHGIDARNLHQALGVGRDFSNWIKARIKQADFINGLDFIVVENLSSPKRASANNEQYTKARPQKQIDYIISLDMAKHLCLMEKSPVGKAIRQHFIESEKQLATIAPKVYRKQIAQTQIRLATIDNNQRLTDELKAYLIRQGKPIKAHYFMNENSMLDSLVLGQSLNQWRKEQGIQGNIRECFTPQQLATLSQLQETDIALIRLDMNYQKRKGWLLTLAKRETPHH